MRRKAIGRILNVRNILIYFLAYIVLFLVSEQGESVVEICGGIAVSRFSGLNVFRIMRWAICVLPPVAVSILFMEEELGFCMIYTVIRAKSVRQWWCVRWLGVFLINVMYPVLFVAISVLPGIDRWTRGENFALFFLIFGTHIFTVSVLSVLILCVCRSLNISVLFFGVAEIALVAIGGFLPESSAYLFPFWGMVKNENYILQSGGAHLVLTIGISAGTAAFCILYTLKRLNGERAAAYRRSR